MEVTKKVVPNVWRKRPEVHPRSSLLCNHSPLTRLRKRANKGEEGGKEAESPEKDHGTATSTGIAESSDDPQMAYGRRTINFYQRGAVGGDSVPLSSYKNKILVFLAATAVYTAFLWKSGGSFSFFAAYDLRGRTNDGDTNGGITNACGVGQMTEIDSFLEA